MTKQKQRNNANLDALAAFLHALRRQPYAIIRSAYQLLGDVTIPPDLLSVDPAKNTLVFRNTSYDVSDETCHFVRMLMKANGAYVSTGDLKKEMKEAGWGTQRQIRPDRLMERLPINLRRAIATDQRGSRLVIDKLLSQV